jgi:tellurite methyltransferase
MDFFKNINIINVLDCGCGNGRDSYELKKKYIVDAVDNCGFIPKNEENLNFMNNNFISINKSKYDLIYSRFTFHSITNEEHNEFLKTIKKNSYLVIEARSIKGEDEFIYHGKTHYRNFIGLDYIRKLLIDNEFEILFLKEERGFSVYKGEDPYCIRVICLKK